MDYRGDLRPPRAARPPQQQTQQQETDQPFFSSRPAFPHTDGSKGNVSFQNTERGDRHGQLDQPRQRNMPSAYQHQLPPDVDPETGMPFDQGRVGRKKSLVRPDREKIAPGHRQWHYRNHVQQAEEEGNARVGVMPSSA